MAAVYMPLSELINQAHPHTYVLVTLPSKRNAEVRKADPQPEPEELQHNMDGQNVFWTFFFLLLCVSWSHAAGTCHGQLHKAGSRKVQLL